MNTAITATATYRPRMSSGQFIAAKISPAVQASVEAGAALIVQEAQTLCPVRSGDLRDSIAATFIQTDTTAVGRITAGMFYAGYVEFGTGRRGAESPNKGPYPYDANWPGMTPRPFMRPALDTTREAVKALFASQIAIGLRQ